LRTPPASKVYRVLLRLLGVAVHCDVPFTTTEVLSHETVIDGVAGGVLDPPPPQEFRANRAGRSAKSRSRRCHRASARHIEPLS
jgi:hypothetical protein